MGENPYLGIITIEDSCLVTQEEFDQGNVIIFGSEMKNASRFGTYISKYKKGNSMFLINGAENLVVKSNHERFIHTGSHQDFYLSMRCLYHHAFEIKPSIKVMMMENEENIRNMKDCIDYIRNNIIDSNGFLRFSVVAIRQ